MDVFYPIQRLADFITYNLLYLTPGEHLTESLNYFIFEVVKIGILFILINYLMAVVRWYLPTEKIRDFLVKKRLLGFDYLSAAILGAVTPFCTCSSIPLFAGFLSAGIPIGVTLTFLISSPLINETSLYLFPAYFGLKTTILYNLVGIVISMAAGMFLQSLKPEKYIKPEFLKLKSKNNFSTVVSKNKLKLKELLKIWGSEAWEITGKVLPYVILGVGIGAIMHGYIPAEIINKYLNTNSIFAVPAAVLIGIPLYANSVSVIPIVEVLVNKGVPLGTALAFMTATVALSLPEALILKRIMKWQLMAMFFGTTVIGIIIIGYLFNLI